MGVSQSPEALLAVAPEAPSQVNPNTPNVCNVSNYYQKGRNTNSFRSPLSRLDPLSSCYYNNFIFTVKMSGIPEKWSHQPARHAGSYWCWLSYRRQSPIQSVHPEGKTLGRERGVQTSRAGLRPEGARRHRALVWTDADALTVVLGSRGAAQGIRTTRGLHP